MSIVDDLAEAQIQTAIERGELDDLPGAGSPLVLDDDRHVPEGLRAAYRLLKNAGYLPPELELRGEIRTTEQLLRQAEAVEDKTRLATRLNHLMARLSAIRGHDVDLRSEPLYYDKIRSRLDPSD
jgi:hypothetical protein